MPDTIDDILAGDETSHYSELRPILRGSFNLSQTEIPFFSGIMSLEKVTKELELVEALPADLRSKWRLEELFQREIDWQRVEYEIVKGYLRRPEKLKFFNSLTVALLPLNERRHLAHEYGDPTDAPQPDREALRRAPWQTTNCGGVQIISNTTSPNGYIRWDSKRVFPATIDGQHRLAALKEFYRTGNLSQKATETGVSVLFLVLDPRAGFDAKQLHRPDDENPILTVVREIFIDLNRHANVVARARQILLDDQGIEPRCLRLLLASRIGDRVPGKLPLGIVHWQHNESAKFNIGEKTGPFITTVELLYSIVQDLLDLRPPRSPLEEKDVRGFVESIESALQVSKRIQDNPAKYPGLPSLESYVDEYHLKEGFEVPFASLNSEYLRVCQDAFAELWQPLIVGMLTGFAPYARFISEVDARGGIDGELAYWLVLPRRAQAQKAEDWGETRTTIIDEPLRQLASMKTKDWPFYAVFQKALFRATAQAWSHFDVLGGGPQAEFLDRWLSFLNIMDSRGVFEVKAPLSGETGNDRLWSGLGLNIATDTVRYNESAVRRLAGVILLWWYFFEKGLARPKGYLKRIDGKRAAQDYPGADRALGLVRDGLTAVIKARDPEIEDAVASLAIDARIEIILSRARKTGASGDEEKDDDEAAE